MRKLTKGLTRVGLVFLFASVLTGSGLAGRAQAFEVGSYDLVVALYGNNIEYVLNLGPYFGLLTLGASTTFTLDPDLAMGTNPVSMSLVMGSGFGLVDYSPMFIASSSKPLSGYTTSEITSILSLTGNHAFVSDTAFVEWASRVDFSGNTIAASAPDSFTSVFGQDFLAGGWSVSTHGSFGSTLYLIGWEPLDDRLIPMGTASLSLDGTQLTIMGPVPIPASLMLFGTGLAGLAGMAGRKMTT